MLIRFVIKNFRSIGEEVEFNMLPAPYKKTHPDHIIDNPKVRALKPSVIYGANGAGKSNILVALKYLQSLVIGEEELPDSTQTEENRLVAELKSEPIHLEVEFGYQEFFCAYCVEFKDGVIHNEQLYELGFERDDTLVFERKHAVDTGKIEITPGKHFFEAKDKVLLSLLSENLLTPKTPLLRMAWAMKKDIISSAYAWFVEGLDVIFPSTQFASLVASLTETEFNSFANRMMRSYDTGIEALSVERTPIESAGLKPEVVKEFKARLQESPEDKFILAEDGTTVMNSGDGVVVLRPKSGHTDNAGSEVLFDIFDESDGSQRLIQFIPVFKNLFSEDRVVFIDEIERSIHPCLLKGLVLKLLSQSKDFAGQIVFTTHECNLLDFSLFRQDEIWFVQKKNNQTSLYPLSDFDIRQDLDIEKGYIQGRFGAIPFMGNMRDLKWR